MEVFVDLKSIVKKGDYVTYVVRFNNKGPRYKTERASIVYPRFVVLRSGTATYDEIVSVNGIPIKEDGNEVTKERE